MALSTGWSASRLAPRTGLPGTPIGGSGPGAATLQQNPAFAQIAQMLGIKPPVVEAAAQAGPLPAAGVDYLAGAATASTPAERLADQIATVTETAQAAPVAPRSAAGISSQSGNIILPNSVTRAAPTPLQAGLAKAIGIPAVVAPPTPGVGGLVGFSGGSLPTGGLAPGQRPYVSPLNAITPQAFPPAPNATIPGVTNFSTLANQSQNMPTWLLNAIQNLNNPDNFTPPAPPVSVGGGFDPRIGATMEATEARIAAQQKALAEENRARIARVKADAARIENEQAANLHRLRIGGGGINYQSGWGNF